MIQTVGEGTPPGLTGGAAGQVGPGRYISHRDRVTSGQAEGRWQAIPRMWSDTTSTPPQPPTPLTNTLPLQINGSDSHVQSAHVN